MNPENNGNEILDVSDENPEMKIPHEKGFSKDIVYNENNAFISSLHLLTNLHSLVSYFYNVVETNLYSPLFHNIFFYEKCNVQEIKQNLEKIANYIFQENKLMPNKNPKSIISFILKDIVKIKLKYINQENQKKEHFNVPFFCDFQYKCCCENTTDIKNFMFIELDIPTIIKNLGDNEKKITIYDCFNFFFDSLENKGSLFCEKCHNFFLCDLKKSQIQRHLIIFIDYGKEKTNYDLSFEINEEIDFKDYKKLNEKDREKQFFLSSFIACKNMGFNFEVYYTFARNNENTEYSMYNGMDVRPNIKVSNKLKKEKMDFKNRKESWPVVLVFTDKDKSWNNYDNY